MSFQDYLAYRKDAVKKKISEHFTMFEIINSDTAIIKKIDNRPTAQNVINATALAKNVLEKIPFKFRINCWLRNAALNKAVGGVPTSQNQSAQAADITPLKEPIDVVFQWIKKNLIYDQVILEESNNAKWIHISFNLVHNRRQSLKYKNGKYILA